MVVRNVVEVYTNASSNTIELVMDDGRFVDIKINLCKIALDQFNGLVYLYDSSESNLARGTNVFEPNYYSLNYLSITNPVMPSALALYGRILQFLQEQSLAGSATSANQVLEIALLTSIRDNTNASAGLSIAGWLNTLFQENKNLGRGVFSTEVHITAISAPALTTAINVFLASNSLINVQQKSIVMESPILWHCFITWTDISLV